MATSLGTLSGRRGGLLSLLLLLVVAPACGDDAGVAPPPEPTLRLLVPGEATLLPFGACTQEEAAASKGHNWCAFHRPAPGGEARTELWVMDVTQALASQPAPCDGSNPSCVRITDRLQPMGEEPYQFSHAYFQGNTLFYETRESPPDPRDPNFEGVTWAWRPGWSRARPITTVKGRGCSASRSGPYAYCRDNSPSGTNIHDVRAGRLIDQDDSLLPLVERIQADIWGMPGFSGSGELFVYSSRRAGEETGALHVIPTAELGRTPARTVATGVEQWQLSGDGLTVLFRRDSLPPQPYSPGGGNWVFGPGSLWAADLSSGAEPVKIASDVIHYTPISRTGVGFLTDPQGLQGTLHLQPDWRHAESRFRMAGEVFSWNAAGSLRSRVTQAQQIDGTDIRVLVADSERRTSCLVPIRPKLTNNYYHVGFLTNLDVLTWWEPDPTDEKTNLTFVARAADCGDVRLLGKNHWFLEEVGANGLVVGSGPAHDAAALSLFHVPSYDGRPADVSGKPILPDVGRWNFALVGSARESLVMSTTGTGPSDRGLYLYGPFPPLPSAARDLP
jgi:hypothetical protein